MERYCADPETLATCAQTTTTDADHGRIETRAAHVSHDLGWPSGPKNACSEPVLPADLACLGMIEAKVETLGKMTVTRHDHLSSRRLMTEHHLEAARGHGSVENSPHWVLDVTFNEDRARNRKDNGLENLAICRKLALNVLNPARPELSVRRKRLGWSDDFAHSILGQGR